jgi:hypothetical protein
MVEGGVSRSTPYALHRLPALFVAAPLLLMTPACAGCPPSTPTSIDEPFDRTEDCFSAAGDGAEPAQSVFDELERSGNGETWFAILFQVLKSEAELGEEIGEPHVMGFGVQHPIEYRGRTSWVGYDMDAGGAIFCTPDDALLELLRSTYDEARTDPAMLRRLVHAVPEEEWDD